MKIQNFDLAVGLIDFKKLEAPTNQLSPPQKRGNARWGQF